MLNAYREVLRVPGAPAFAIPGVFNALVAKIAERLGFRAIYLSGGALSAAHGVPDVGLLTLSEFVAEARTLAASTALPLLCDADTGFGEALNVERTVRQFEEAGVAGIHLEDQVAPKRCGHLEGKQVIPAVEMARKIAAAIEARRTPDFFLIARTDSRAVEGFDAAVDRAQLYLEAGADAIFPEALETEEEFAEFARRVNAPLLANMTEFGKSPLLPIEDLEQMGYAAVLYPVTLLRVAMKVIEASLDTIASDRSQAMLID